MGVEMLSVIIDNIRHILLLNYLLFFVWCFPFALCLVVFFITSRCWILDSLFHISIFLIHILSVQLCIDNKKTAMNYYVKFLLLTVAGTLIATFMYDIANEPQEIRNEMFDLQDYMDHSVVSTILSKLFGKLLVINIWNSL